jgi:hypothetical protein
MDTGKLRELFGVLLILDPAPGFNFEVIRSVISERIAAAAPKEAGQGVIRLRWPDLGG